ncbi:PTS cellobiose transporter subunit IIC [Clostridium sp. Marseille-Q2269]|uniref:PTS cellobiose transporter subunit IIC n=1 Tax=Clostridium sp. Marseille-Q2269 TaxID=2942205 RepID=UPI0020733CA9|nr:PTS cellobiose transporter subunit IIC [Clostridium sp. Marseille-Q2269]
MNKLMSFLENKVMPVASKIASLRYIRALRDGLAVTMPLVIVGSIFMLLANLPIAGYADFVNGIFGDGFVAKITYPIRATFDILTLVAVMSVAYQVAKQRDVDGLSSSIVAVAAFVSLIPVFDIKNVVIGNATVNLGRVIQTNTYLSAGGLIVGIIVSIFSAEIYAYVVKKNWVIKMPDSVPPAVSKSFVAITPAAIILTLCWLVRLGFEATSFQTIFGFISEFVSSPLSKVGLSFGGMLLTVSMIHVFWALGIHGSRVVFGVMDSILLPSMDQNRLAFEAGKELPNIITKQFYDCFTNAGGLAVMGLVILMLFVAKSKQIKSLGKLAVGPIIFNIAEPVLFGLPIIMNPIMIIPFIVAPLLIGTVTYWSMALGLVSFPAGVAVPWTVPIFMSGFLSTGGDFRAVILQAVNLLISIVVYYPFLKIWDKKKIEEEQLAEEENVDDELAALVNSIQKK